MAMHHETITYSCGHKGVYSASTPSMKDFESRVAYAEKHTMCPDCYAAQKAEAAKKATADLPELKGSEKQISWANSIRAKKYEQIIQDGEAAEAKLAGYIKALPNCMDKLIEKYGSKEAVDAEVEKASKPYKALIEKAKIAKTTTSASWWIEHR